MFLIVGQLCVLVEKRTCSQLGASSGHKAVHGYEMNKILMALFSFKLAKCNLTFVVELQVTNWTPLKAGIRFASRWIWIILYKVFRNIVHLLL